jgi:PhnB protein
MFDAYLYFTGNCREAMAFYHEIFGGDLNVMDTPEGKVMHARLSGGLIPLMASDGTRTEPYGASMISLNLSSPDEAGMHAVFDALSNGGIVTSPFKKEFWGDTFGSLTDKFGIDWQISITQQPAD